MIRKHCTINRRSNRRASVLLLSLIVIVLLTLSVYILRSFKAVFADSWPRTLMKAAGVGFVYSLAALPAFTIILVWASLT